MDTVASCNVERRLNLHALATVDMRDWNSIGNEASRWCIPAYSALRKQRYIHWRRRVQLDIHCAKRQIFPSVYSGNGSKHPSQALTGQFADKPTRGQSICGLVNSSDQPHGCHVPTSRIRMTIPFFSLPSYPLSSPLPNPLRSRSLNSRQGSGKAS